jgi:hypothetical protein
MDRLYSHFPGGGVGLGLFLLRLIVAAWYVATGVLRFGAGPLAFFPALVLMGAAVFLTAGVRTSANSTLGGACSVLLLLAGKPDQWFPLLLLAGLSLSLALLGPGGYSLDARLSGWRTIDLSIQPQSDRTES